jgi:hypothetical protein
MVGVEFGGTDSSSRLKAEKGVAMVSCQLAADNPAAQETKNFRCWLLRMCELCAQYGSLALLMLGTTASINQPSAVRWSLRCCQCLLLKSMHACLHVDALDVLSGSTFSLELRAAVRTVLLSQKLQKAAFQHKMLLIPSGARESIRFLPPLNISAQEIDIGLEKFEACCKEVFG